MTHVTHLEVDIKAEMHSAVMRLHLRGNASNTSMTALRVMRSSRGRKKRIRRRLFAEKGQTLLMEDLRRTHISEGSPRSHGGQEDESQSIHKDRAQFSEATHRALTQDPQRIRKGLATNS